MLVGEKIRVEHPKCKEVFGTIERVVNDVDPEACYEITTFFGYQDWHEDLEEAKRDLERDNEMEYNGSAGNDRANCRVASNHERAMLNGGL